MVVVSQREGATKAAQAAEGKQEPNKGDRPFLCQT